MPHLANLARLATRRPLPIRHTGRQPLDARLRRWLTAPGSLTAHLRQSWGDVRVIRIRQGGARLWPGEREALGGRARLVHAHVREVLLCAAGQPLVYARSVLDSRHARTRWKAIRNLGTRPLAELLFGARAALRSPLSSHFQAACQPDTRQIARRWQALTGQALPARGLWARRSVFMRGHMPLLVTELMPPPLAARPPGAPGRLTVKQRPA